jgi:hypothetical protein
MLTQHCKNQKSNCNQERLPKRLTKKELPLVFQDPKLGVMILCSDVPKTCSLLVISRELGINNPSLEYRNHECLYANVDKKQNKIFSIPGPNAVGNPPAMVVILFHTIITARTM